MNVGSVCKCCHNKVGIVTKTVSDFNGDLVLASGIGFDGKPWQSIKPTLLAESVDEYLRCDFDVAKQMLRKEPTISEVGHPNPASKECAPFTFDDNEIKLVFSNGAIVLNKTGTWQLGV